MRHTGMTIMVLFAARLMAQEDIGQAKETLDKWYETQRILSKEETDWRVGREIMQDRVDLTKRESESVREKITKTQQEIAESEKKIAELKQVNDTLKRGLDPLQHDIRSLELRVLSLVTRTSETVRQRVAPLTQRIPTTPTTSKLSISERYQNVIGVLNELNKVAREISIASEVRVLKDGKQAEVTVFYLGLSQAYYVNEKSRIAGVGHLDEGGVWRWDEQNQLVDAVALVVGIYKGEKPAAYVPLAIKIQ
jgi:septal ring factor EnvC (AmiA/AmiB activator)